MWAFVGHFCAIDSKASKPGEGDEDLGPRNRSPFAMKDGPSLNPTASPLTGLHNAPTPGASERADPLARLR
ncbi:hypothetical protein MPTK2_8g07930 [Marchantia polymorpha subsp. ruderalis]